MAEEISVQTFFSCLNAVNHGCQLAGELKTKVESATGSDFNNIIWNYSVKIVSTFGPIFGMITPNYPGIENPPAKHCQKKSSFSSPWSRGRSSFSSPWSRGRSSFSSPRSGRGSSFSAPRSRRRSPMDCSSPSEYVDRSSRRSGKLKFHELAESSENEGSRKQEEPTISTKRSISNSFDSENYIPPDGYKWRKYTQRSFPRFQHPRSYYICNYNKKGTCQAEKVVQRPNDKPWEIKVKYIGDHSCQRDTQIFKTPTPYLICEIQNSNTNPNSRIPTTPVFGTDSYNLQSNPSSTGNNILTRPPADIPSSSCAPLFAANGGGVSLDSFGKSSPNVDSFAQRATSFTGHSADQMNRLEGNVDPSEQSAMPFTTHSTDQMCGLQGSEKNPYSPPLAFPSVELEVFEHWLLSDM